MRELRLRELKPPVQGSQTGGVRGGLEPPLLTQRGALCVCSPPAGPPGHQVVMEHPMGGSGEGVSPWVHLVKELCFWVPECGGPSESVELISWRTDVGLKWGDIRVRETGVGMERGLEGNEPGGCLLSAPLL